jgi:metallo-beta-lactamase class B
MRHNCVLLSGALSIMLALAFFKNDAPPAQDDWTQPFPAFRVAGNLYYVGSKGLASYLITSSQGHSHQQRSRGQCAYDSRECGVTGIQVQ